jgi:glycosyltransferase involved in cell wall biosynthesis
VEFLAGLPWTVVLAAALALGLTVTLGGAWRNRRRLPELPPGDGRLAELTVVIPARNEARNIERAVRSFAGARVLVIDDASSDDTAARARAAGAAVFPAPPWRDDLPGKANACRAGASLATTRWILFADADTWYAPGFAASLVAYARAENLDLVSVFPVPETGSFFEHMLVRYEYALRFAAADISRGNAGNSPEVPVNGQCLLYRRSAYEFVGGHTPVMTSLIEDVPLMAAARRHRLRTRAVRSRLAHARDYAGFREIWEGLEKNSYHYLSDRPRKGVRVAVTAGLLMLWPPAAVLLFLEAVDAAAVLFAALPFALLWPWFGARAPLALPAAYLYPVVALNGVFASLVGRRIPWKGRRVAAYRYAK